MIVANVGRLQNQFRCLILLGTVQVNVSVMQKIWVVDATYPQLLVIITIQMVTEWATVSRNLSVLAANQMVG